MDLGLIDFHYIHKYIYAISIATMLFISLYYLLLLIVGQVTILMNSLNNEINIIVLNDYRNFYGLHTYFTISMVYNTNLFKRRPTKNNK